MTETERIRAELTERGTDFDEYDMGEIDGEPTRETTWMAASGLSVTFVEYPRGATRLRVWEPTAQQALDMAGRGTAYRHVKSYGEWGTTTCSACHAPVEPSDNYCARCGARLTETRYERVGE